ncbi:ClpP/crotonase-like domain-containing protein [Naematelia encephala]|uniref:ClpP/crotonase-like domain-containing protein n=1 Tax=Naematelia encephala TaxID=71784 RepID=A0A1Y2AQ83_9TREE|nr:ClpP/crotonase-like domain-containing protein [Naematelia encephala]
MAPTTLSRPSPTTWQISLTSPPDNRLTPDLLPEWRSNVDGGGKKKIKRGGEWGAGAVILTSDCPKFFSNGLDYEKSLGVERFFENVFDPVTYRLLTFPLVTICAINGHAFAGGMILSLCCDFRLITSGKGLLCMNELQFGSPIPNSFAALLRLRIPHPPHLTQTMLAKRWTQPELLQAGLVDAVVDDQGEGKERRLLEVAVEWANREGQRVKGGAWGSIKDGLYHDVIDASRSLRPLHFPAQEAEAFWARVGTDKARL